MLHFHLHSLLILMEVQNAISLQGDYNSWCLRGYCASTKMRDKAADAPRLRSVAFSSSRHVLSAVLPSLSNTVCLRLSVAVITYFYI
jgi:hypothetical protein